MDRPALKRRRVVTTCSECHRRKQKCDRRKPCNICLIRKVPDLCSYSDEVGAPRRSRRTSQSSEDEKIPVRKSNIQEQENVTPPTSIADQIGYSPLTGSNVYMDLQHQLLKDETNSSFKACSMVRGPTGTERWELQFWNLVSRLPSNSIIEELLDVFQNELDWYSGFVEQYYIQQLFKTWQELQLRVEVSKPPSPKDVSRDVLYFAALLFQTCAVALHFIPPEAPAIKALKVEEMSCRDRLSETYSNHGMELMEVLGRHRPTIVAVQHDIMRALWLKDCGRGTESWHALCNSTRQAQELNMHRQARVDQSGTIAETLSKLWYDEYKRRVWVVLFIWDSHMSMMLGRPRLINIDDCSIQVPIDCKFPDDPSIVVPTAIRTAGDNEVPTPISGHLFRYSISQLVHEMKSNGANRRHPKDYNSIQLLHEKALSLMDGLPPHLRPQNPDTSWDNKLPWIPRQRETVLDNGTSFILSLHRPHIHTSPKSRKAAVQAAIGILDSQQRIFEVTKQHQYKMFGLAFFTIDAGFFLCSTAIMYPSTDRDLTRKVDMCLQEGMKRLEIIEPHNAIAGSSLKLLRHCYQLLQDASVSRASLPPTAESFNEVPATVAQPTEHFPHNNMFEASTAFDNFHPVGTHTQDFPEQMQFPSTADLTGFPNINEFDSSYWIDQMAQIPFVALDEPVLDTSWNFPFS